MPLQELTDPLLPCVLDVSKKSCNSSTYMRLCYRNMLVHIWGYATATFLAVMLPLISGGYATAYFWWLCYHLILAACVILFSIHNL